MNNQYKWPRDRSQNGLGSSQDGSKMVLKRCFFRIDFYHRFWFVLGSFWDRCGCHLGPLLGAQIGHFWYLFFDGFCMLFQDRPKSGQERSKSRQEPPKSVYMGERTLRLHEGTGVYMGEPCVYMGECRQKTKKTQKQEQKTVTKTEATNTSRIKEQSKTK